jgi:ABC-type sugar transport system permease subunit
MRRELRARRHRATPSRATNVGIGSAVSFITLAILTVLAVILLRRQRRENTA